MKTEDKEYLQSLLETPSPTGWEVPVATLVRERMGEKPVGVVGLETDQWVAIDFVDALVHIFLPEVREFYDLEHLWEDAHLTRIPDLD